MVQLSHLYMTIGKTIALTIQTFVGKLMSLFFFFCFNKLSRLLIDSLPGASIFYFHVAITVCSDFGAQEK